MSVLAARSSAASRRVSVDSSLVATSAFADLQTIIRDTCRRFTRTTGWHMAFQPARGELADELETRLRDDDRCYWFSRLHSGFGTIGFMVIDRGRDPGELRTPGPDDTQTGLRLRRLVFPLPDACDAAEIVVNLLNQIATRAQVLELSAVSEPATEPLAKDDGRRLEILRLLSGFDAVALFLLTQDRLELRATAGLTRDLVPESTRPLRGDAIDRQAMRTGELLACTPASGLVPPGFATAFCTALDRRSKELGTLWFYSRSAEDRAHQAEEIRSLAGRFAGTMDDQAVSLIAQDNTDLRRELRLLGQIQKAGESPQEVRDHRLDFSFFSRGTTEVNGDLCEQISLDEHRTVFAIGDACGHGLPAAVITTTVRGCLRCLVQADSDPSPAHILRIIGDALTTSTPTYMFMTMFLAVADTQKGTFRYANAGHPAPALVEPSGDATLLDGTGMLLGVMPEVEYAEFEISFRPGQTLVAFSDGVSEARDSQQNLFLTDGVLTAIRDCDCRETPARELVEQIMARVRQHSAGRLPDDTTLCVLRHL